MDGRRKRYVECTRRCVEGQAAVNSVCTCACERGMQSARCYAATIIMMLCSYKLRHLLEQRRWLCLTARLATGSSAVGDGTVRRGSAHRAHPVPRPPSCVFNLKKLHRV